MENAILIIVILLILGLASWYVIRAKKNGKKCIGCPDGCCNTKKEEKSAGCGCGCSGCPSKDICHK